MMHKLESENSNIYRHGVCVAGWFGQDSTTQTARLVACWNACLGIDNPEAVGEVIAAAKEALSRPQVVTALEFLDRGIGVATCDAVWLRLRAALAKLNEKGK